jgi:hypothetical protein
MGRTVYFWIKKKVDNKKAQACGLGFVCGLQGWGTEEGDGSSDISVENNG